MYQLMEMVTYNINVEQLCISHNQSKLRCMYIKNMVERYGEIASW